MNGEQLRKHWVRPRPNDELCGDLRNAFDKENERKVLNVYDERQCRVCQLRQQTQREKRAREIAPRPLHERLAPQPEHCPVVTAGTAERRGTESHSKSG
jgi:hypothetical protein